jgi:P27 family predicted phage terminase small subunit
MAYTHRKAPGKALGHRDHRFTVLQGGGQALDVPPPPRGLQPASRKVWAAFWDSQVAQVIDPASDLPAITQWIKLVDEEGRLAGEIAKTGFMILGSMGQPVLNPLFGLRTQLRQEIHRLRGEFGMTPAARLRLGLALGEMQLQRQAIARGEGRPSAWQDPGRRSAILDEEEDA